MLKKQKTSLSIDLLNPGLQLTYNKNPQLLVQQIEDLSPNANVLIDEIQRVPRLLNVNSDRKSGQMICPA